MNEHHQHYQEVLKAYDVNKETGLTQIQVQEAKSKYGLNKLREEKKKTILQRFTSQFKDAMILVLIVAAIISFIVAILEHNPKELFEPDELSEYVTSLYMIDYK